MKVAKFNASKHFDSKECICKTVSGTISNSRESVDFLCKGNSRCGVNMTPAICFIEKRSSNVTVREYYSCIFLAPTYENETALMLELYDTEWIPAYYETLKDSQE